MLDLIGWRKTASDTFVLRAFVLRLFGQYSTVLGDAWEPTPGDSITDPAGLTDIVVSVKDTSPGEFEGLFEHAGWTTGMATITRKAQPLSKTVDILGPATVEDNPVTRETDIVLNAGYTIEHIMTATDPVYGPPGWPHASVVEISPQTDLLEIQRAMWFSPQGSKLLVNTHATNSFVVKFNLGGPLPESNIVMYNLLDITVAPGETVAFIRDTRATNDRWLAARNSPIVP
ncbi:MAG: hypothetical protein HRU00_11780 [Myxococcales bacterium]|nr:hypothetical protein [Myxococcales bacterium]